MIKFAPVSNESAFNIVHDDKTIGKVGWHMVNPSVAHVWTNLSDGIKLSPIAFHKAVLELIDFAFEMTTVQRIQFSVRCDHGKGADWAKALGFEWEGIMKNYEPDGADCWLYARVK